MYGFKTLFPSLETRSTWPPVAAVQYHARASINGGAHNPKVAQDPLVVAAGVGYKF